MISKVEASSVVPCPVCEITAEAVDVRKTKIQIDKVSNQELEVYEARLKILECSTHSHEDEKSCDELYPIRSTQDVTIDLDQYKKTPIDKGMTIKAKLRYRGDEWSHGNCIFDIQILESAFSQ